jgi:hypothetical protein
MVPGGFKRFPDGEKAERVQDHHVIITWRPSLGRVMNRTAPASYWFFMVFFKL